jgi:hypothetical protein
MSTDALIRNIAIPVGSILLVAIVLSTDRVQGALSEILINVNNPFRWSETGDMRPYIQREKEREREREERDSDYKSARGSFSEGGSKKSKSKTKKSKTKKR